MTTNVRPAPSVMVTRDLGPAPSARSPETWSSAACWSCRWPSPSAPSSGKAGAASVGFAAGLVLFNFLVAAALLGWAARISLGLLMGVSLFGFVLRLAAIAGAVLAVKDMSWVEPVPLGITLIVTHLGLLFWETKFVSASLAFPGLKPSAEEQ